MSQTYDQATSSCCGSERSATVLLVDDDAFFRELLNGLLSARGYNVIEARSPQEAESYLRQRPDLAIIDYQLPNMNGADYITSLRERGFNFPIVFCSGSTYSHSTFNKVRNLLSVDLVIRKPIKPEEFLLQIDQLLPASQNFGELNNTSNAEELAAGADMQMEETEAKANFNQATVNFAISGNYPAKDNDCPRIAAQPVMETMVEAEESINEMLRRLAADYLNDCPALIAGLRRNLETGLSQRDVVYLENAANSAHQLKGTAGSHKFFGIGDAAGRLELALKTFIESGLSGESETLLPLLRELEAALAAQQGNIECQTASAEQPSHWAFEAAEMPDCGSQSVQSSATLFDNQVDALAGPPHVESEGLSILIVDQNPQEVAEISEMCRGKFGRAVLNVSQSIDVVAALERCQPDLVLIDSNTTGIDATTLCRMIRCNPKWSRLGIVMLTSDVTAEHRAVIFSCGADDYIVRPVVADELQRRLARAS